AAETVVVTMPYVFGCGIPTPYYDVTVPLGAFAEGHYLVRFVPCVETSDTDCTPEAPLPDVPFAVAGGVSGVVQAPALGMAGLAALGAAAMLAGVFALRRRNPSSAARVRRSPRA